MDFSDMFCHQNVKEHLCFKMAAEEDETLYKNNS